MCLAILYGLLDIPAVPAGAASPSVETAHLVVVDEASRLTQDELLLFSQGAEAGYLKILQFWSLPERAGGQDKIVLELLPDRRGHSFSVFVPGKRGRRDKSIVRVFGMREPREMAHKLTHAVFPTEDKLVRNMMGIPTEERLGNSLSFPMCGFPGHAWVVVLLKTGSFVPLVDLGASHEDWGMSFRGAMPVVSDRKRQHASYAQAGSFGAFLISRFGVEKVKSFYERSRLGGRPWKEVFGADIATLQAQWLASIEEYAGNNKGQVELLEGLWKDDPVTACFRAQRKAAEKPTPGSGN